MFEKRYMAGGKRLNMFILGIDWVQLECSRCSLLKSQAIKQATTSGLVARFEQLQTD